jgi:hypothetical protein
VPEIADIIQHVLGHTTSLTSDHHYKRVTSLLLRLSMRLALRFGKERPLRPVYSRRERPINALAVARPRKRRDSKCVRASVATFHSDRYSGTDRQGSCNNG